MLISTALSHQLKLQPTIHGVLAPIQNRWVGVWSDRRLLMYAAFPQSSSAASTSTCKGGTHTPMPIPRKACLPFLSGTSKLPVDGCTMRSWQSLGVHWWMTLLIWGIELWLRILICRQGRHGMRLSWKTFNPGDRVLELRKHRSLVSLYHIWLRLLDQTDFSKGVHWCTHVPNDVDRAPVFYYFRNPGIPCWYWLCNHFVYVDRSCLYDPVSIYIDSQKEYKNMLGCDA